MIYAAMLIYFCLLLLIFPIWQWSAYYLHRITGKKESSLIYYATSAFLGFPAYYSFRWIVGSTYEPTKHFPLMFLAILLALLFYNRFFSARMQDYYDYG